ncbi:hypothetical protein PTMSG1_09632 [Pyrenophora teres f. maculata]|nr:hypothetical protein PTMSG1_09632 [Pyrenophora teres f. maculata]
MKATTLLQFALLVLPALGEDCSYGTNEHSCTAALRCQCTYEGTSNRCAVKKPTIFAKNCHCPQKYYGHTIAKTCCIDIFKYNGRYKCTLQGCSV